MSAVGNAASQTPVVAVMQPYLFPYLGYYQLLHHADVFVLYDDAHFIQRGFINRNRLLANGRPQRFTIPVIGASQNRRIRELRFGDDRGKLAGSLRHHYAGTPEFARVLPLVESVLAEPERDVTQVCRASLQRVMDYLELPCAIRQSSELDYDRDADAAGKLASLCQTLGSNCYVNPVGGRDLYREADFRERGVTLSFLRMDAVTYPQAGGPFVPDLSIIDLLMWCTPERAREMLGRYTVS